MPRLTIHIKTTEGGIIKDPSILLSYTSKTGDNYLIQRMLKLRKVDKQELASRPCAADEVKECSHPHRAGFLRYDDWDLLITDERNFTTDPEWIGKLEDLKRQFPQFIKKGGDHGQ